MTEKRTPPIEVQMIDALCSHPKFEEGCANCESRSEAVKSELQRVAAKQITTASAILRLAIRMANEGKP